MSTVKQETRGRKPKFKSGATKVMRIPEKYADIVEKLITNLEDGDQTLLSFATDCKPVIDLRGIKTYQLRGKEVVLLEALLEYYHLQRAIPE